MVRSYMAFITKKKIYYILFVAVIFLSLFLSGCEKDYDSATSPSNKQTGPADEKINEPAGSVESLALPLKIEDGSFHSAYGWISDYVFVYVTESSEKVKVFSYDLKKGKNKLLFESEAPIVSLYISPSRDYILIHSSPSSYHALTTIIDTKGHELFSKEIPSLDLAVEWNSFNENMVALTAFSETWEYTIYSLNISQQTLSEIDLPQPFFLWVDSNELLYLDWDDTGMQHFAPLKKFNLQTGKSEEIISEIFYADSLDVDGAFVILVGEDEINQATYSFYTKSLDKVGSFSIPLLSSFSDWVIPYFEYVPADKSFLTFQPLYSAEADVYTEKFELMSYSFEDGEKEILMEGMDNEPLSCSPNGDFCLYGFYFENLLNLKTGENIPLL